MQFCRFITSRWRQEEAGKDDEKKAKNSLAFHADEDIFCARVTLTNMANFLSLTLSSLSIPFNLNFSFFLFFAHFYFPLSPLFIFSFPRKSGSVE